MVNFTVLHQHALESQLWRAIILLRFKQLQEPAAKDTRGQILQVQDYILFSMLCAIIQCDHLKKNYLQITQLHDYMAAMPDVIKEPMS
jgi:hypothetical protein